MRSATRGGVVGVLLQPHMTALAAACTNHPMRKAIGICIRCRCCLCDECTTKLAGINHCVTCLAWVSRAEPQRGEPRLGLGPLVCAATYLLCLSGLVWWLLTIAYPNDPAANQARQSSWQ